MPPARHSDRTLTEPSRCGKCHYAVTGLPTRICPECGSDLSVVGIRTPQVSSYALSFSFRAWAIAWVVIVFLTASGLASLFSTELGGLVVSLNRQVEYTVTGSDLVGSNQQTVRLTLDATGSWCRWRLLNGGKGPAFRSAIVTLSIPFGPPASSSRKLALSFDADGTTVLAQFVDGDNASVTARELLEAPTLVKLFAETHPAEGALNADIAEGFVALLIQKLQAPQALFAIHGDARLGNVGCSESMPSAGAVHWTVIVALLLGVSSFVVTTLPLLRRVHRWQAGRNRRLVFPSV